ncbi:hypothetical protein [Kitasatospora sp. NPDC057198]|uniref:hypothetical protein n=1 Tax=Kitasatospora sp. NPDC057198 TaxID=3346046 RepID=UPI00362AFB1F
MSIAPTDRDLVQYTEFSRYPLTVPAYERALRAYIGEVLGLGGFTVEDIEQGAGTIPARAGSRAARSSPG